MKYSFVFGSRLLSSLKIVSFEREFKIEQLDELAILILTTGFAMRFCLNGFAVSWKEFLFIWFLTTFVSFCFVLFCVGFYF